MDSARIVDSTVAVQPTFLNIATIGGSPLLWNVSTRATCLLSPFLQHLHHKASPMIVTLLTLLVADEPSAVHSWHDATECHIAGNPHPDNAYAAHRENDRVKVANANGRP